MLRPVALEQSASSIPRPAIEPSPSAGRRSYFKTTVHLLHSGVEHADKRVLTSLQMPGVFMARVRELVSRLFWVLPQVRSAMQNGAEHLPGRFQAGAVPAACAVLGCSLRLLLLLATVSRISANELVRFTEQPGALAISLGDQPLATYVYQDQGIPRPYFANVYLPGGPKVTRNHPPIAGQDDLDHGSGANYFHPGIWLAFSDLNGNDYWRLKAAVRHEGFVEQPAGALGRGTFVVRNSYRQAGDPDRAVCTEVCRCTVLVQPSGYLLVSDSRFWSDDHELVFGDQEEMGLGLRVARPLAVKHGGRMLDSAGRVNEREIWGQEAAWCDDRGTIGDRRAGVMLLPDPANRLPSRFHARDYGFFAANPFGSQVFGEPEPRRTVIPRGQELRLRFGVLVHSDPPDDLPSTAALYRRAVDEMSALAPPAR